MPGIDEVDRQFRRRNPTAPTDGELAAERGVLREAAAAKAIGDEAAQAGMLFETTSWEAAITPRSHLSAVDRRDARLSALALAVQVLPETPAAALADGTPVEAVTLRIARAFERWLLGDDDPPKPSGMTWERFDKLAAEVADPPEPSAETE